MSDPAPRWPFALELFERSLGYLRGCVATVRPGGLTAPTPCAAWTLGDLLRHLEDSLDAFAEAAGGRVLVAAPPRAVLVGAGLAPTVTAKAGQLVGIWLAEGDRDEPVAVGDSVIGCETLLLTGALELTVHGWDVARAAGAARPVPTALALDLLPRARVLVECCGRGDRFGPALPTPPGAGPAEVLLALTGRRG